LPKTEPMQEVSVLSTGVAGPVSASAACVDFSLGTLHNAALLALVSHLRVCKRADSVHSQLRLQSLISLSVFHC